MRYFKHTFLCGCSCGLLWSLIGCLSIFAFINGASASTYSLQMEDDSPVQIKVETGFTEGPMRGHVELAVHVTNGMKRAGTWQLEVAATAQYNRQTSFVTKAEFSVPAGQQQTFKLSVPIAEPLHAGHHSSRLAGTFVGNYTEYSTFNIDLINYRSGVDDGILLLSPELYRSHGSALQAAYEKKRSGYIVAKYYSPKTLPEDWRCYVGFNRMLVTRQDWQALRPNVRTSILDAVAVGELELHFQLPGFNAEMAAELEIPSDAKVWRHGLGIISRYDEPMDAVILRLENGGPSADILSSRTADDLSDDMMQVPRIASIEQDRSLTRFEDLVEDQTPPAGLLSLLMLGFGILIGPVNFFVFAKGRRSLRLFVTTPIIAGSVSLLLLVGILFFDGVGGKGYIARLIYMGDDDQQVYVEQEQLADTGLYFAQAFEIAGKDWVTPRGSSITDIQDLDTVGTFTRQGEVHAGDWFVSKRLQAMNSKTYLPSRESFDLIPQDDPNAAPKVFSNFRGVCDVFYYVDAQKNVWKGEQVKLGAEQTLRKVDEDELLVWFVQQRVQAGARLGRRINRIGVRPEHFYASVSHWQQDGLNTVNNIKWDIHTQLLVGRFNTSDKKGGAQ